MKKIAYPFGDVDRISHVQRRGVGGGGGRGVFEPWHLIQVFNLPEQLNIRAVTIFVSVFLSIFCLCDLAPCMLEVFARGLNTTTSMTGLRSLPSVPVLKTGSSS